jgi:hypothetical protein
MLLPAACWRCRVGGSAESGCRMCVSPQLTLQRHTHEAVLRQCLSGSTKNQSNPSSRAALTTTTGTMYLVRAAAAAAEAQWCVADDDLQRMMIWSSGWRAHCEYHRHSSSAHFQRF